MCTLLISTNQQGLHRGRALLSLRAISCAGHLDMGDLRAGGCTMEGFYFYLNSPVLPSLSPQYFSAVLLSPWLEIVSRCITMASLGTFPFLQLLGNVSPICMDGLRSFLNEQARIKACASAPISLLPSSALRRRPGSDSNSIHFGAGTLPPAACLCHHTVLAKTILRYVRPDRFWMTVGHGSTLRGGPQYSCTGVGLWAVGKPQQWARGLGFCALLGKDSTGVSWALALVVHSLPVVSWTSKCRR